MAQRLSEQNPAGNIPLLAYRLVEAVAVSCLCPQEWPLFRPHVERLIESKLGPLCPQEPNAR